jgi:predicted kinase
MNHHLRIVVFTGLPGTGKTTLSRQLAEALALPLIAKDAIKEIMYDTIGWSDTAFSAKLAHATFGIMDYTTEQLLRTGNSLILESNYTPKLASDKFQHWQHQYACDIDQIVCRTDLDVLARRFYERSQANRHPGHLNNDGTVEAYRESFVGRVANGEDQPLTVEGRVKVIDTTDFSKVNPEEIIQWARETS